MDLGAIIAVAFWSLIVCWLAWDEARREKPPVDDDEAHRAFVERNAREYAGRDA